MFAQIPFDLTLVSAARFDNFIAHENRHVVQCLMGLEQARSQQVVFLWGEAGIGKTHLLQAVCQFYSSSQQAVMYLPLQQLVQMDASALDGLDALAVICIDDVQAIAGNAAWEQALFHAYNRMSEASTHCIFAARSSPKQLPIQLPDLQSRLTAGLVFHLQPLEDEQKIQVLRQRADAAGFSLPSNVAEYLLRHQPRDLTGLCELLDRLDHASLAARRKLTIPFIKTVLDGNESKQ